MKNSVEFKKNGSLNMGSHALWFRDKKYHYGESVLGPKAFGQLAGEEAPLAGAWTSSLREAYDSFHVALIPSSPQDQ